MTKILYLDIRAKSKETGHTGGITLVRGSNGTRQFIMNKKVYAELSAKILKMEV